jgi:uncharacterized protein YrzB (UPF0473 family)
MSDEINNPNLDPEEEDDLIELVDENGETTVFEHLATLEYEGDTYLALCEPTDEESDDDEDLEVFILKIEQDEDGNDVYTVPDDDVADAVFEKLVALTEDLGEEE